MVCLFERHRALLDQALDAISARGFWSAYSEIPSAKIYGENAKRDGECAFRDHLNKLFPLAGDGDQWVGEEVSPFGMALGISYERRGFHQLIASAEAAKRSWSQASVEQRTGVCLEILSRLNARSFEMAHAVMHTSGQPFVMAFQAGGPHAQDRGLEAVAYAYREMKQIPDHVVWEKPQGERAPIRLAKEYKLIPRGIGLVIACSTFPTWNSYPGLFASLATGNPVIVKPHAGAILPLAITVRVCRDVLNEAGLDPDTVQLAIDTPEDPLTKDLVHAPEVRMIDYTGNAAFGDWIESNAGDALVFTEEAGVNSVVIDSTDDFAGMCQNLAFSLSLYSGQMCTAPQNLFVSADGIDTDQGHKSFESVAAALAAAIDDLLAEPERAAAVLGTIQNEATLERVKDSQALGSILREPGRIETAGYAKARTCTPLIIGTEAGREADYLDERFGPISFMIRTHDTAESIERAAYCAKRKGAITAAIYTTDDRVIEAAADAFADCGVALSCNFTGPVYVNQSAAFSDFHVTGANPAGNASLTDTAFVANRFRVVAVRRPDKI
ncbi:MAG: phenylacetic acid degradation protein PaaN [Geminicoccaceae bacterium]